jgi:N-formylglutamate deformylase
MTQPPVFELRRGSLPLFVSMPHIGTFLPAALESRLSKAALRLEDTDWHVDRLYGFLDSLDVTVITATHSRYLIDLNRPPDGSRLYPGRAETLLCPLETFAGERLYRPGAEPDATEVRERRRMFWQPYHDTIAAELARLKAIHSRVLLFDAHSIRSTVPRLFEGTLPDLNFGTADGQSAADTLVEHLLAASDASSFSRVVNGRFKGGYITRHYGRPTEGIEAIQLELGWNAYLDPTHPDIYDPVRAAPLVAVLERIIAMALEQLRASI